RTPSRRVKVRKTVVQTIIEMGLSKEERVKRRYPPPWKWMMMRMVNLAQTTKPSRVRQTLPRERRKARGFSARATRPVTSASPEASTWLAILGNIRANVRFNVTATGDFRDWI